MGKALDATDFTKLSRNEKFNLMTELIRNLPEDPQRSFFEEHMPEMDCQRWKALGEQDSVRCAL